MYSVVTWKYKLGRWMECRAEGGTAAEAVQFAAELVAEQAAEDCGCQRLCPVSIHIERDDIEIPLLNTDSAWVQHEQRRHDRICYLV